MQPARLVPPALYYNTSCAPTRCNLPKLTQNIIEESIKMHSRIANSILQIRRINFPSTLKPHRRSITSGSAGRKEEDDREYFSHHKPSALSEIEMADTRKPITKATDGTAAGGDYGGGGVVGWLPEQLETAEETMMRAAKIWEWNKMRGDPDSPHSRVLRALRGEPGFQ